MNKVRYGIIGIGNQGSYYLRELFLKDKIENGVCTAICDINDVKLALGKELGFDGAFFHDYKELIDSGLVDAILIETSHYIHPEIAIYALNKGVNVLCDKPAGVYTKQVREMNEIAKQSNKLFGMIFNQRTDSLYRKMREIILNNEIGEINRINWIITNWYRTESYYNSSSWRATWKGEGGGVLINQCPHQLDLLQWVTNMMPKSITAFCNFGKYHDIEVEDEVTAYLEYENGANGVFITTTGEAGGTNRFEIVGNNGKLVVENGKLYFTKLHEGAKEFSKSSLDGFKEPSQEMIIVKTDNQNTQHLGIINNFTNAVLGKEKLFVNGEEGIKGVELMNAMLLSTFLNKKINLPVDEELYLHELNKRIAQSRNKIVEERILDNSSSFNINKSK